VDNIPIKSIEEIETPEDSDDDMKKKLKKEQDEEKEKHSLNQNS